MTDVSYVPGEWTAVAGDRCWALIDAAPDSVTVREIWQRIEDGAGLDMLMVSLLRRGLREAPDFALLATHDGCSHLFCRGRGSATLSTEGTPERLTGTGLVTWREHPVTSDVVYVVLGDSPAGTDLRLPASTGVFLAQSITIALTGVSSRRTEAAAARPFAAPEASAAETAPPASMAPAASVRDAGATLSYPGADAVPDSTARAGADAGALGGTGYDFLFGASQVRSVEEAAVRPAADDSQPLELPAAAVPAPQAPPVPPPRRRPGGPAVGGKPANTVTSAPLGSVTGPEAAGPEDGSGGTVRRADLLKLASRAPSSDRIGPTVPALLCPGSHPSPPSSSVCRVCGVPLPQQDPVTVPRPVLGVLLLSTGDVITLDRGVVMGRSPRTDFDGEERPHIVRLPSGDGEISRTHLQVSLDGWHVMVTDLKSTNGTLVTLPRRDPERLRPNEPFPIQLGTVVTLADDIYFRYEEPW